MKNCEITLYSKQVPSVDSDTLPVGAYFVTVGGDTNTLYQRIEAGSPQHRHVNCSTGGVSYSNIQNVVRVYPKISVEVDY